MKDAQKLYANIMESYSNGDKEFEIPDGVYRLSTDGIPTFEFRNMKDFKITGGDNVYFVQTKVPFDSIKIVSCENLTIEGIKLDCEPPPFAQGTITEIDCKEKK